MLTQEALIPLSGWRRTLYIIIYEADTRVGRIFDLALIAAILLSVLTTILESVQSIQQVWSRELKIIDWFLENGYPELAALSHAIQGSDKAVEWLLKNKFPHFAALDAAIDNDKKAYEWLKKHKYNFLIVFADACHEKPEAIAWLNKKDLKIFVIIAERIKRLRDSHTFDYHKLHF